MKKALSTLALGALAASSSSAAEIIVASNITTSTTWTANNTYNIQTQIYVEPGATLMPGQKRILECPKCRDKVSKTVRVWD